MGEKRKRSSTTNARAAASAASKRQSNTPALQPTPALQLTPETSEPEVPTTFARDRPLPVFPKPQVDDLSLREYKSVAESKVLAESLARSQRKWVDGDIFEKFWIKPLKSRKLDPAILEKNPGKETMIKLGNARMHCMPHKFEIRFYQVLRPIKDQPHSLNVVHQPPQYPMHIQQQHPAQGAQASPRPLAQNASPVQLSSQPTAPLLPPQNTPPASAGSPPGRLQVVSAHNTPKPPVPAQHPHPRPQQQQAHTRQEDLTPSSPNVTTQPTSRTPVPPQTTPKAAIPQSNPAPPKPPQPAQASPAAPSQPRPDPVVQMLAIKAATDVKLKELMRIVASGKATREQLQEFQGYIDSLTAASNNPPLGPPGSQFRPPPSGQQAQFQRPAPQPPRPMHIQQSHMQAPQVYQPPQSVRQFQQPHLVQQRPLPQPKTKAFPQPPRQELVDIVFEFLDSYSQGDRFRFPRFTILEYLNRGTTVRASFIVIRKLHDTDEEMWQPITVTLETDYPRILEPLRSIVADQETTRTHMKQIMDKLKCADETYLVYRLRREPGEVAPEKTFVDVRTELLAKGKDSKNRRESDTIIPTRDVRGGSNSTQQRQSGPKVKHVKKHISRISDSPGGDVGRTSNSVVVRSPPSPPPLPRLPKLPKPPRSRKGRIADPTKSCHICKTSKTSLWRKADIEGENVTVCNACGIKWKTSAQKQAQIAAAVANGQPIPIFPDDERRASGGESGIEGFHPGGAAPGMFQPMEGVESVTGQVFANTAHQQTVPAPETPQVRFALPDPQSPSAQPQHQSTVPEQQQAPPSDSPPSPPPPPAKSLGESQPTEAPPNPPSTDAPAPSTAATAG